MSFPFGSRPIRLAMLGMVEGNGHPYSWSAIINGRYDATLMADCGYPVIPQYLGAQPKENLGIEGVEVTHVWCDQPADADRVAAACFIPNVVERPEDVLGQVDAVIIPTDKGFEHVRRARPFIHAGLPVFIDKPLCDNREDLAQFIAWHAEGKPFLSTSAMRYDPDFAALKQCVGDVGHPRLVTMTTPKSWQRYGIHALEGIYSLLRPGGWQWVVNSGTEEAAIVHARHADGIDVVVAAINDMYGAFCCLNVYGTMGRAAAAAQDTFTAFKTQLVAFIQYLRTGQSPVTFDETVELMKLVIAGIESRQAGGLRIAIT